jgi:ABC-type multidrug transport system ATPase subunit
MEILRFENVSKWFDSVRVLQDVELDIPFGQSVAVLGDNGAGKSTLLRLLSTMSLPSRGSITIDGERLEQRNLSLRKKLMYLPDFPEFNEAGDMLEHIAMCLKLWEAVRPGVEERVEYFLTTFDLMKVADYPLQTLSRGQRYKVALTALFVVDPHLWLLDEPFASGIDSTAIKVFREEMARATEERGRLVVWTTQMPEIAESCAHNIMRIQDRTIAIGATRNATG